MTTPATTGLDALLADLADKIAEATTALEAQSISPATWQTLMQMYLARYSTAAIMTGQLSFDLSDQALGLLVSDVQAQLAYLDNFVVTIQSAQEWQAGWSSRAQQYADSIKIPYWRGATQLLPLPAMPAQGTDCRGRCKCMWDVQTVDEQAGDYDAFWLRHAHDSCSTCVQRGADWAPIRIRGGLLE